MRKRDLKKIIYNSFGKETPDLKDKILASCKKECQEPKAVRVPAPKMQRYYPIIKRIAVAAICLALFISGLSFGMLIPKRADTPTLAVADTETLVFLDVNPSIELKIDKNNATVPLKLQVIESEHLDSSKNYPLPNGACRLKYRQKTI